MRQVCVAHGGVVDERHAANGDGGGEFGEFAQYTRRISAYVPVVGRWVYWGSLR